MTKNNSKNRRRVTGFTTQRCWLCIFASFSSRLFPFLSPVLSFYFSSLLFVRSCIIESLLLLSYLSSSWVRSSLLHIILIGVLSYSRIFGYIKYSVFWFAFWPIILSKNAFSFFSYERVHFVGQIDCDLKSFPYTRFHEISFNMRPSGTFYLQN